MLSESVLPAANSLNFRIISEGLFQPILQLTLTKNIPGTISGTANLILKELGRELNLCFKIYGIYKIIPHSSRIWVSLKGYKNNNNELSLEIEMNKEWTTGIANYQYHGQHTKIIRNATVSSELFVKTQFKTQNYSSPFF